MKLSDLIDYDIIDLLMLNHKDEDERGVFIYQYMQGFAEYLSDKVADMLSEDDQQKISDMIIDPDMTPEKLESYYREKIPDFDNKLFTFTLIYKKDFLMDYYKDMLSEIARAGDDSLPLWISLVSSAEQDDWETVNNIAKKLEDNYLTPSVENPESTADLQAQIPSPAAA